MPTFCRSAARHPGEQSDRPALHLVLFAAAFGRGRGTARAGWTVSRWLCRGAIGRPAALRSIGYPLRAPFGGPIADPIADPI